LLTPENPKSNDVIADTSHIVQTYKQAIQATGIKKVVALSCIGSRISVYTATKMGINAFIRRIYR